MTQSFLARYQAGEHEQVWAELVALGPAVREEPVRSEARAVAEEMMRRAQHNVGLIVERLREIGYRFVSDLPESKFDAAQIVQSTLAQARAQHGDKVSPDVLDRLDRMAATMAQQFQGLMAQMRQQAEQWRTEHGAPVQPRRDVDPVWEPPNDALRERVSEIAERYGPLPLTLELWFEIVGEVDLCGVHPKLSCYVDRAPEEQQGPSGEPLVVACMIDADELDDRAGMGEAPPFTFDIAPDASHKSNYSGGGPTGVEIPNAGFDAPLVSDDQWDGMYFIPYLRTCFQWGGFPGLKDDAQAAEAARGELAMLTKDLLVI